MDTQGGIRVQDICCRHPFFSRNRIAENHIKAIVAGEHEIRHAVYMDNKGCLRIKAHQGHSEEVVANMDAARLLFEIRSADDIMRWGYVCCHGTSQKYLAWIRYAGLKTFGRKQVHCAKQTPSRLQTDKEVLSLLSVTKWLNDGGKLYPSGNVIFLTPGFNGVMSPLYFQQVRQLWPTEVILW